MRLSKLSAIIVATSMSATALGDSASKFAVYSTWMLLGAASDLRWVEIHKIEGVGANALYHISVLRRLKADPVWNLKHVVSHMAITGAALSRSVAPKAAHMGAAYPETYNEGYEEWLRLRERGDAPICDTTVIECAHL